VIGDLHQLRAALEDGSLREHRHPNVELKQSWTLEHGRKLSALANKLDVPVSWLVVGVDDDGKILGRDEVWARATEQTLSQHINGQLDPVEACKGLFCAQLPTGWIVAVQIANPGAVVRWSKEAFKASGTTIALMEPDEIVKLTITLPGRSDHSKQPDQSDLDEALLADYQRTVCANGACQ